MNKKSRIGLLGCGAVAHRWYLKGLSGDSDHYELIAVCDINEAKAKHASQRYKIPHYFSKIEDFANHDLDMVVVLTRHNDHFLHNSFLLAEGINIYSEKPLADTYAKARQLVHLAKENHLTIGAAPQVMLSSRNRVAKSIVNSGAIGKITLIRASSSNLGPAGRADTDYDPEWFYAEGGSMVSLGIYGLSTLLWIMGVPQRVSSFEGIAIPDRTILHGPEKGRKFRVMAPDNVVALLDFGNGTFACLDGSYSVTTPPNYEFEIHGTEGSLFVGGHGGQESVLLKRPGEDLLQVGPIDDCHLRWSLAWGPEETIQAIRANQRPETSPDLALTVLEVIDAMRESARTRNHISLPIAEKA